MREVDYLKLRDDFRQLKNLLSLRLHPEMKDLGSLKLNLKR